MVINKINLKSIYIILIIVSLALVNDNLSYAGTVVIKPGQFDHFTLQAPDKIIAGENFIIKAQVYDSNNNLITNFSETGKEFRVDISGSATLQPSVLSASSFAGGTANISINSKKAEKVIFSIRESGGTVPVITRELIVSPNKLDHFVLQAPKTITAGNNFDVRIIAKDLFDNNVSDMEVGRNIKVTSTGTSPVKMIGSSAVDFKNSMATAVFMSEKAGNVIIELQEISTGSSGRTQDIIVNPSSLSYFKVQAPKNTIAGEEFELLIAAYDMHDNIVTNYSSTGSGVTLSTTGSSKVEPSFVNASEFKNGQTVIKTSYDKAEGIQIIAKESNREQTGKTGEILVSNAFQDHFVVLTPDTAVSGQKFKIKVEAYDRFNNLVKNYNLIGNDVILGTTGTGSISPIKVSPSEFANGVAMVDVVYDKAESFLISAKMAGDRVQGRITLKEQEIKKEVPLSKAVHKAPEKALQEPSAVKETKQPKTPVRKEVKPKVKEVTEKEEPKKEVIKKEELKKETVKKEPLKKEVEQKEVAKKEEPKKEVVKKEEPKKEPARKEVVKKEVKETVKKEPAKREEPRKEAAKKEEPKKPAVEVAKKEDKKIEKQIEPFKVSNISIIEAKNKAMLVVNITNPNGRLEYSDEIESKYGKEWLKLRISPALNLVEKSLKFTSAFVGEVLVEEDKSKPNTLYIYIELIPSGVTFDIARVKNTLIITLANP